MSDDLDVALGLDGGFGRPKKRNPSQNEKPKAELKPSTRLVPIKSDLEKPLHDHAPVIEELQPVVPVESSSDTAKAALEIGPTVSSSSIPPKASDRPIRRQAAASDTRYGKLISLRVPSHLFEELERRAEEMGAKTVGQFLVAVLKIALGDQAMLAAPDSSPVYSTSAGLSAAERLRATFAQKASAEASRQMTIRLDMGSVSRLAAAAKAARVKERAPYILAILERQLRAL